MSNVKIIIERNGVRWFWFSEDQIGEVARSEHIIYKLIDEYEINMRLPAFDIAYTPEEYHKVQEALKALEEFRKYAKSLPEKKLEHDRMLQEEKELEIQSKKAEVNRGDDIE